MVLQGQQEKDRGIRYEIDVDTPPLGEGGTGIVRKGVLIDENSGNKRDVAIKFLFSDLTENVVQRSRREACIRISHENLIEMIDFVQVGNVDLYGKGSVHYHVVSELLQGVMLLDILNGDVSEDIYEQNPRIKAFYEEMYSNRALFAIHVLTAVLSGIKALHDHGYVHRDIDPSNIMITNEGSVKLIDLGIAKKLNSTGGAMENVTSTGQFVGKAAYAAPELIMGDLPHQDQTTDIYAVGVLLYQLLTGTLPFKGSLQEIMHQQMHSKLPLQNVLDKNLRDIISKATEKKQSLRYQSADQFIEALKGKSLRKSTPKQLHFSQTIIFVILALMGLALGVVLGLLL